MERGEEQHPQNEGLGKGASEYADLVNERRLPNDERTEVRAYAENPYETAAANARKAGMSEVAQMLHDKATQAGDAEVEYYDKENARSKWLMETLDKVLESKVERPDADRREVTKDEIEIRRGSSREETEAKRDALFSMLGVHGDPVEVPEAKVMGYHGIQNDLVPLPRAFDRDTDIGVVIREVRKPRGRLHDLGEEHRTNEDGSQSYRHVYEWVPDPEGRTSSSYYAYRREETERDENRRKRTPAAPPYWVREAQRENKRRMGGWPMQ